MKLYVTFGSQWTEDESVVMHYHCQLPSPRIIFSESLEISDDELNNFDDSELLDALNLICYELMFRVFVKFESFCEHNN
jgi:hypothetical protein